jgi:hypothetical protein
MMNTVSRNNIRDTLRAGLVVSVSLLAAGCSPPPDRTQTTSNTPAAPMPTSVIVSPHAKSEHFRKQVPSELQAAARSTGGLCPVDSINVQATSAATKSIRISRNNPFAAEGWAVTPNPEKPVYDYVYLVLTSAGTDYFLSAARTERADVAKGAAKLRMAGFKGAGFVSDVPAGRYQLRIASGDTASLILCDSSYEIVID